MEGFLVRRDRTTEQDEKGKRYVVVLSPIPHSPNVIVYYIYRGRR